MNWMSRLALLLVVVCCLALVAGPAVAQKGKPPGGLLVTSTLHDAGQVTPDPGTNNRIQSDGNGSYFYGVGSVQSIIQDIGDWVLDTSDSSTRSTLVDFRDPVAGSSTSNAPFDWQLVNARWISKCSQSQSGGYTGMAAGSTLNCPLHATFTHGGVTYRLTMNPVNDAATSFAQVTCNSANAAGQCNNWSLAPATQADSSVRSIAVLIKETKAKGKTTLTNLGYFYMTFQIEITNP